MRLGLSTGLKHESPKQWAQQMKEIGCGCVVFPVDYRASENLIADYADAARDNDLVIAEVGIWRNVFAIDPAEREAARAHALGQFRLAEELGALSCVNVSGTYGGKSWYGGYRENFTRECWDLVVEYTKKLIDEVKPTKTEYGIEPMPWMIPTSPDQCLALVEAVDRECFGVHMDVVNMINCPERYFGPEAFLEECFDKLGPMISSCHLKDVALIEDPESQLADLPFGVRETPLGTGVLPLEKYVELANRYNPQMPMIIEHLHSDEQYRESAAYVLAKLRQAGIEG